MRGGAGTKLPLLDHAVFAYTRRMTFLRSVALLAILAASSVVSGCSSSTGGTVDVSKLAAPCTGGTCSNGGVCTNFSDVDTTYDLPFCVTTQHPCDLVSCNKGSCTLTRGSPSFVHCGQ